ncbi:MAG: DUF4349 domain-containing protein [Anaerolineae bacterium]|nr:DUF4349 domain-containing protein [Anaerolineae bacterium]
MITKTRIMSALLVAITVTTLFASCCPAPAELQMVEKEALVTQVVEKEAEVVEVTREARTEEEPPAASAATPVSEKDTAVDYDALTLPYRSDRLIIKNAELSLLVADTDNAIDRTAQIAADTGGYILSSRVWYQEWLGENYKYATITIGVPAHQFEVAMRRLRGLAVRVIDENASGQDVTDEYVDLQSRLENLEATRDRIRTFLEQTKTVTEALTINEELKAVEEEMALVQGRMNYLFDRAAYSTITVDLNPELPDATPTPTPTATPTPTPTPPWNPGDTVQQAGNTLGSILRVLIELTIWIGIVVVPLVAPPVLVVAFVTWTMRRWTRKRAGKKDKSQSNP